MKKKLFSFLMVILFLPVLCFSQSFDWKKVDEWCPSSFPDFLEGIAYSHLVMGKEITDFIEDNKSSHSSAFVSGVLEYLNAMGFQKAQWGAYPGKCSPGSIPSRP